MLLVFRNHLLSSCLGIALVLGAWVFQSHPPRAQADLAQLETILASLKQQVPESGTRTLITRNVSSDYRVWARYFAAPRVVSLAPPQTGDTVWVLSPAEPVPASPDESFRTTASNPFRITLERFDTTTFSGIP